MYLSRRQILALLLATAAQPSIAETRPPKRVVAPPPKDISEILKQFAPSGKHSIVVADALSGQVIEASQEKASIPPASVAKALTTVYALQNLGSNWRFRTRLVASSSRIENGILQGDLTLEGGGDPALDTDGLADLIKQLRARGITGISGKFEIYDGGIAVSAFAGSYAAGARWLQSNDFRHKFEFQSCVYGMETRREWIWIWI